MNKINLQGRSIGFTNIPNTFIDEHMVSANEAQIKIYLYLLRCLANSMPVTIESIAEKFNYMEKDILRALMYWDKKGLLSIEFDKQKNVVGICLNDCDLIAESIAVQDSNSQAEQSMNIESSPSDSTRHFYPQDQILAFQNMENAKSLIFATERYFGKTLNNTDYHTLLYLYEDLHFSVELIEYLIEYCVNNGHRNMRYIEKTAIAWANDNITTVAEAKKSISRFKKEYFDILKLYGISGRNPVEVEIEYMNRWFDEFAFDMDVIKEAINRTIINTSKPSYSYTDKILSDWYNSGVHHFSDIPDNKAYRKKPNQTIYKDSNDKYRNYNERQDNYNELAKELIQN